MRFSAQNVAPGTLRGFALGFCLCLCAYPAQSQTQKTQSPGAMTKAGRENVRRRLAALSPDDGLTVIAAALDSRVQASRPRDCSHLVHAIYVQAGFPYSYASSSDLYAGGEDFQRVSHPQPGDLVVWPGHVGIVVNPAQRVFFSRLERGPGIDGYDTQYWKQRGQARFYRYIKNPPARVASTHLVGSQRLK
ncbi:MAG TPA: NlpC/P60 family protein [Terriglobales bacterium]|nr:NlpC/P60 family protein [Terriglobales bacterium]